MSDFQMFLERDPDDTQPMEPVGGSACEICGDWMSLPVGKCPYREFWTARATPAMRLDPPEPTTAPWWALVLFLAIPCGLLAGVWLLAHGIS